MTVSFYVPHIDRQRVGEILRVSFHKIGRAIALGDALFGAAAGTSAALASAVVLRLPDTGVTRLVSVVTAPEAPPAVDDARTFLLVVVFGSLIWAAGSVRKLREWFHPTSAGDQA